MMTPAQFDAELQKLWDLNDQATIQPLSEAYRAVVRERDEVRLRRQETITMCVHLECAMETLRQQLIAMKAEREAACGELLVNIDATPVGSHAGKLVCANRVLRSEVSAVKQQLTAMTARANENERKLREVCQAHGVALIDLHDRKQEIERLRAWMTEFIEGNACIPKDYAAGVYTCNQCHVESQPNGDFIHLDDCDIVECRQLLAGTKEGA